jgi:hypothetical protein
MAEQWPFKPFVEGSSPPALTKKSSSWKAFYFIIYHTKQMPLQGGALPLKQSPVK